MRGLDPRIHLLREKVLRRSMDCRVKPGNDDLKLAPMTPTLSPFLRLKGGEGADRVCNRTAVEYQRCGGGAETVSFTPSMPMNTARIRTGFCPVLRPLCTSFIASARASPWR